MASIHSIRRVRRILSSRKVAREQAKWLELSSNARQLFTDRSSDIPFDQPGFLVDAIRGVYTQSN